MTEDNEVRLIDADKLKRLLQSTEKRQNFYKIFAKN